MLDDEEGDAWFQHEPEDLSMPFDEAEEMAHTLGHCDPVQANREGESLRAVLNTRFRRSTRMVFFDDESGQDEMHQEPDDVHLVAGIMDKRGWPEFSKAAEFTGAWLGMVFKRGPLGSGATEMSSNSASDWWATLRGKRMRQRSW